LFVFPSSKLKDLIITLLSQNFTISTFPSNDLGKSILNALFLFKLYSSSHSNSPFIPLHCKYLTMSSFLVFASNFPIKRQDILVPACNTACPSFSSSRVPIIPLLYNAFPSSLFSTILSFPLEAVPVSSFSLLCPFSDLVWLTILSSCCSFFFQVCEFAFAFLSPSEGCSEGSLSGGSAPSILTLSSEHALIWDFYSL